MVVVIVSPSYLLKVSLLVHERGFPYVIALISIVIGQRKTFLVFKTAKSEKIKLSLLKNLFATVPTNRFHEICLCIPFVWENSEDICIDMTQNRLFFK